MFKIMFWGIRKVNKISWKCKKIKAINYEFVPNEMFYVTPIKY